MRDRSNIVFFGNCQSEVLCAVYNRYVAVRTGRRARYIQNYAELSADDEELIRNAEIVVEQKLEFAAKTGWGHIATGARLLQVPLISGAFLWPFAGQPHPASKSLDYLGYGPFGGELGDGYLNRLFQAKTPPEAALTQYAGLDIHKTINLDRTLELHLERQRQREHGTGVRMADFIEENFCRERLFHSPFHLSLALVAEYARQFLPELGAEPEDLALMRRALTPGAHRYLVRPSVYLFETPIHPAVTRHYRLEWAPSDRRYRYFGESGLSFDDYVRRYVGFTWNADLLEGIHLTYHRQDEEAWAKLEHGLARDPESAEGHFCLALLRLRRDDPAGAIAALRSAAEFDPGDAQYPALLGEVLHRQGEVQAAAEAYREALALDPGNADYAVRLASVLNGSEGPAPAIRSLRESLNFAPFAAGLYLALARLELASGRLAKAEQGARTASELEPGSEAALDLLREALLRQGRAAEAATVSKPASGAATRFRAEETDRFPNHGSVIENSVTRNETSSSMAKKHLRRKAARRGSAGGTRLMNRPGPPAEQPVTAAAATPAGTVSGQSEIPLPERIAEAIRLRDAGQFEEAETLLSRACHEFADNPAPAIEYARVAEARKDWKQAERRWSHVREKFERNEAAYMGGVIALRQLRHGDTADGLIAEALSKFPGHHWFLHQQAQRAGERRDWPAAEEGWRTSLAANPAGIWWVHAELARALAEQGRIAEAEEVLVRGQELHPTESGLFVEHARLAERRKDWDEAFRRWQSVRNQFPNDPRSFTGIAITHRERGRIDEAEAVLTEAVERFPQDLWTFIEHARLAEARRDTVEALRRWERVRETFPAQAVGYTAAATLLRDALRFEEAESLLAEATQRFPAEPRLEIDRAILAHHRRDWAQAAHRWERVRARLPDERSAYLLGAAALRELSRLQDAEALLSDAVKRFPAEAGARVERVLLTEARGEWAEAAEAWAALRTEFPQDIRAFISGARCLRQLGRTDEAEAVLLDAMGRFPEDAGVLSEYAWLAQIARNWPEAAKRWETVRARHPELTSGYSAGAAALREAQRFDEADNLLTQAARQFPDDAGVMIERGRLAQARRNWQAAAESWARVRARLPLEPEGYVGLATALTQMGELGDADTVLREGTERVPSSWWLSSQFAEIATTRNDWPEALARWTETRRRFPQTPGLNARVFEARLRLSEVDPAAAMAAEEEAATNPGTGTMYDIMMAFESLGHGCEFGTVQREYGAEPLGLLRWGAITPQDLIEALNSGFDGIGAPENTEVELRPNGNHDEYWVADKRFGMEMHTFIGKDRISYERMFAQSCRRMEFLSRKLLEDLRRAEKIFVYKLDNRDLTDDEMFGLHDALRRYGEVTLLCVRKQNESEQNGHVEIVRPGLMVAYIDRFAGEQADGRITVATESWSVICRKAYDLWQRARTLSAVQSVSPVQPDSTDSIAPSDPGDSSVAKLLMNFESLGGDYPGCEIGLVQRRFGAEPLGLLRWTTIQPRGLVRALKSKFEGIDDPSQIEIYIHAGAYKAKDRRYGTDTVTFIKTSSMSDEEMLPRLTKRFGFLRQKLLEDLASDEKIFVYRTLQDDLAVSEIVRIKDAMSTCGKNKLLYIRLADAKHRPGDVESVQDDLAFGYVAQFSREPVRELYMEGWQRMFERAADLWLSSSVAGAASSGRAAS